MLAKGAHATVDALYWSWQAQLKYGDAENLADIVDLLPPKVADEVRGNIGKTFWAELMPVTYQRYHNLPISQKF